MQKEVEVLRDILSRDGLCNRPFLLMSYAWAYICSEYTYEQILQEYAAYIGDAPERAHADLCRRILKAGHDIGPQQYLEQVRKEVFDRENGVLT